MYKRQIQIQLEEGGVKLLRVSDDGSGMARDELVLALTRHATSKINSLADLERVGTLGFRGEALASVAAVACLTLTSRQAGSDRAAGQHAWRLTDEPGASPQPAALQAGTVVEMRDLYYNCLLYTSGFLRQFKGGRDLHEDISLAIGMLDFHRQQVTIVGQPELGRRHPRDTQVQAAKRPGGSLDVLVTDHFEAIRGVLLAGGDWELATRGEIVDQSQLVVEGQQILCAASQCLHLSLIHI